MFLRRFDLVLFIICFSFITILPSFSCKEKQAIHEINIKQIVDCDSIEVIAGAQYRSGRIHKLIFGKQYREEWTTPVKVPCLKLSSAKGGLEILKLGGGRQTKSLRVISPEEIQYNIRSVDKNPEALLPKPLRSTFLKDIVQDMISTAHPYGALVVPLLAEAAGIHHTKPELVFVPYNDELGEYKEAVGGMLAMIEIRPDEDLSSFRRFGNSKNVIGSEKLYEKLRKTTHNKVDEELYLRSRLFDMFINDWDRHEDQWRWAEFESEEGITFEPVPRDRDQVFVKMEGALPHILSRKWGFRNIRNFSRQIDDVEGINLNARYLDRLILNELPKEKWLQIAKELQIALSDSVIAKAVLDLPPEIFKISGEEMTSILISRRNNMEKVANEYYNILAERVDVTGSDENEIFYIERKNEYIRIRVVSGNNEKVYERDFYPSETSEIIMHPLKGNDKIYYTGESNNSIDILIFSGDGNIEIIDHVNKGKVKNIELLQEPSDIYKRRVYRG